MPDLGAVELTREDLLESLRMIYEPLIRTLGVVVSNGYAEWFETTYQAMESEPGAEMFVSALMTLLCTAGIGFYARFLIALRKERKPRSSGYWVRMRLDSGAEPSVERQELPRAVNRAA